MSPPARNQAIEDIQGAERALIKTISPNDTGSTGAHQAGYYLPKAAWELFAPFAPTKGVNREHRVTAIWPDGRVTDSRIKWYGRGTRNEYRLTSFGRNFPYLQPELIGGLLVLIPETPDRFRMHVIAPGADVEDLETALGIELIRGWAKLEGGESTQETEDECVERRLAAFVDALNAFPATAALAEGARLTLKACGKDFDQLSLDEQLVKCMETEFALFKRLERKICTPQAVKAFKSIDQFIKTANSILQRRKARAGLSLENQMHALLVAAKIPHEMRPVVDKTRPDIVIPGSAEYCDRAWPVSKLFVVGVKRTCKDRWRQVLKEAPRVKRKHLLTIQNGISANQLDEIRSSRVELIVPKALHRYFPKPKRSQLLTIDGFADEVRKALSR